MIATLLGQVKQYQKDSILTPFFTAVEVLMEVLIPFVTAQIIDKGIEAGNIENVYSYGLLMLVLAAFSLVSGILAGTFAARASSGFACNLRDGMYENIQTFSFSNIDKYSRSGHQDDHGCHECTELLPDDTPYSSQGAFDADLQYAHVLCHQCEAEPVICRGYGGTVRRAFVYHEPCHADI